MLAADPLPAFPGVLELMMAALASDDFEVAIATSSTRQKSEAVLKSAGIPYKQIVYVNGDDVTHKKPDPELFLIASTRIGVPPARCVVIEDAPNGVQAAKAAGCQCIAVTNSTTVAKLSQADLIVDDLSLVDLTNLVQLIRTVFPRTLEFDMGCLSEPSTGRAKVHGSVVSGFQKERVNPINTFVRKNCK